ncbi:hypothetical protein D6D06_06037 [Aureobasidium pullulans]|nr:hypothetical protein D6D06_06037 [Aureobasidium pullulans]
MDALPLEIKENICSFLSPSHLRPLRLVSKEFASAAILYFIPRIFLFNHPDSCIEMNAILRHPEIPKYINTLIVDPSPVQSLVNFYDWVEGYNLRKGRHFKTELGENRDEVFHGLPLEYSLHPVTVAASCLPPYEGVAESLQTITIKSIELNQWNGGTSRNLRHLRVSLRSCESRPSPRFDAMIHSAIYLETLWIEFPWMHDGLYSLDSLLRGIRLEKLHECLLFSVSVSEDELVDFLLHHTQSLRTFGIGGSRLHEGSWPSLFRRLSCHTAALKQFAVGSQLLAYGPEYTGRYMAAVTKFVLHGGPEPVETLVEDFPHDYEDFPRIVHDVQDGLWKDYDRMIKPYL